MVVHPKRQRRQHLVTVNDPLNHATTFVFDGLGRLTSAVDALGKAKTFGYDQGGFLSSIVNAKGNALTLKNDARGNVIERTSNHHGQNHTAYFSYYLNPGNPADPRNDKLTETRDARSSGATDNTYRSTSSYDAYGNVLSAVTPSTWDYPSGRSTAYTYTNGSEPALGGGTIPIGLPRTVTDPKGATTTYDYDAKGDLRRVIDPLQLQTDSTYDNLGRRLSSTEISDSYPAGLVTTWTYDELNSVLTETKPTATSVTGSGARTPKTTYAYDANENVASMALSDVGGLDTTRTTIYDYDDNDRVIALHDPAGGTQSQTFDDAGNLATSTSPAGVVTAYGYTVRNELASTTIQNFVDDPTVPTTPRNLVVEQRTYDDAGRLDTVADALGRTTQYQYTNDDLLAAVILLGFHNPDNSTRNITLQSLTYDGAANVTQSVTGGGLQTTNYVHDAAGRLASQTLDPAGLNRTTTFLYDGNTNVLRETTTQAGVTNEKRYFYNAANLPLTETVENGATDLTTTFTYDRRGLKTSETDPRWSGYTTTTAYDQLGRPTTVTSPAVPVDLMGGSAPQTTPFARVNFQSETAPIPSGYTRDYGLAYSSSTGSGWENESTGVPVSLVGNGRDRNVVPDQRMDTLMHMQLPSGTSGVATPGRWQLDVPNGTYNITAGVGDPSFTNSQHVLRAEGTEFIDFTPTSGAPQTTGSTQVNVSDGRLTIDAIGGTNTKINYVDVDEVAAGGGGGSIPLVTRAGYDTFGNVIAEKRPDPGLAATTHQYDALDRLVVSSTPVTPGNCCGGSVVTESWTYDADGNMKTSVDTRGKTTSYDYDKLNRLVRQTDPQLSGQPSAGFMKYGYDDVGNVVKTTDQRGAVIDATYDDLDRVRTRTVVERIPSPQNLVTTYEHDDLDNLTSSKDPLNNVTSAQYNAAGERTTLTDEAGKVTQFSYDLAGRMTQVTDPLGRKAVSTYDQAGRMTSVVDKDAANVTVRTESYGYDAAGNETSVMSPNGWVTTRTYDALNRLRSIVQPTTSTVSITTSFGYDYNGNRTFVTDGRGNTTWTTYNALDLESSVVEPSTPQHSAVADRTWNYNYDAAGNLTEVVEPGPVTQSYTYDNLDRMTNATGTGGSGGTASRTLGYDLAGNVASVGAPGGAINYARNDRGEVTSQSGVGGTASFTYDANGRIASKTDAAGTTTYTYTPRSQVATVADPLTAQTFTYTYDDAMQLSTAVANGKTRTYGYDALGRVTSDALVTGTTANNRATSYGYDDNSNLTNQTIVFGGSTTQTNTYAYDRADRLTNWTQGGTSTTYTWDASGNRTKNGGVTSSYNERNHLVSDSSGVTYTYTKRGTMASRTAGGTTVTMSFDSFDRLIHDSTDSGMNNPGLSYDGLDRLYARNGGTALTYDRDTSDVVSDPSFTHAYAPDGTPLSVSDGTTKRALLTNQHGDITGSVDVAGSNSTARTDYDPFGRKSNASGLIGNLGYQGSWNNPTSSAQRTNMWKRWYAPNQGVFLSRDAADNPISGLFDVNRHTYGNDNPLRFNDPTGQFGAAVVGGGIAIGGGAVGGIGAGTALLGGGAAVVGGGFVGIGGYGIYDILVNKNPWANSNTKPAQSTVSIQYSTGAIVSTLDLIAALPAGNPAAGGSGTRTCQLNCGGGGGARGITVPRAPVRVVLPAPDASAVDLAGLGLLAEDVVGSATASEESLVREQLVPLAGGGTADPNCLEDDSCLSGGNPNAGNTDPSRGKQFDKSKPNDPIKNASDAAKDATRGGRGPVEKGQQGLDKLGIRQNTESFDINGRTRIPDVLSRERAVLGEVKNVERLAFTRQIRDYLSYAQSQGYRFDLYVRETTRISRPLERAVDEGLIKLHRVL